MSLFHMKVGGKPTVANVGKLSALKLTATKTAKKNNGKYLSLYIL